MSVYVDGKPEASAKDCYRKIAVNQMMDRGVRNGQPVAIVLPTYCEAENIESLIRELQGLKLNLLIFVIDDSSPDGTAEIVKKLQEEHDNIFLFIRPKKMGLGTAIINGFRLMLSLKDQPKFIITMDADYSHSPQDIPALMDAANCGADLVVGSRYCSGGKIIGSHWRRKLISRLANFTAARIVGVGMRDCTSGFRCYSRNYVESVLHDLHSETYEVQIETLRQARIHGFTVKETPITFVNRKRGKSKLTATESKAFLTYTVKAAWEKIFTSK